MKIEQMREILAKGILAPSADNLQPWKLKLFSEANRAELWIDPSRAGNFCDAGLRAPYLSCGAFVENVRLAAQAHGFSTAVQYLPDFSQPIYAAEIQFSEAQKQASDHARVIEARHTNRKFYNGKEIPGTVYAKMDDILSANQDFQLLWMKRSEDPYVELSKIIGDTDQLRFEIERLHQEFCALLRFDSKKAQDGLDVSSLEAGATGPAVFSLIKSWKRMMLLNRLGMSWVFNQYAFRQMMSSAGAGLLIAKRSEDRPDLFLQGGELMQRIWHETARQGLAFQPMEALPIFDLALMHDSQIQRTMSKAQIDAVSKLLKRFRTLLMIDDKPIIFFFRVGYAKPTSARAQRRPFDELVVHEETQHETSASRF